MNDRLEEWLSAPAAYPEARQAIGALDPVIREEFNRGLERIDLQAGEVLFAPGEPRDAAFLILSGHISVTEQNDPGGDLDVQVFSPGEGVGEIGLANSGPYTTCARALDDTRVFRLGKTAFERLCEKYPEAIAGLADFITPVAHETLLGRVICDLLGERDSAQLSALLPKVERLELKRGDILVREGEYADRMFVVVSGRLRIVTRNAEGAETIIDEIGRGDTAGERSLLTGDATAATVYALRDSTVGVITRPVFENLKLQYPEVITRLTRIALRRVQRHAAMPGGYYVTDAVSFAILPVGTTKGKVPLGTFTERLAAALSRRGKTLHLSSTRLEGLLGRPGIAQASQGSSTEPVLTAWLQQQEQSNCYVIYEADDGVTPWTERCLRMADRVLLVGLGAYPPEPSEVDELLKRYGDSTITEMALIQPDGISQPSGTAAWLTRYAAIDHHHIRLSQATDFNRFVRRVTGCGLGLVLGGGGARGFAHMGVFKALSEYGVTVDLVGGTSIGGVLGATFAMGLDYQDIMKLAEQVASPLKLFDPTIPVVSFFASGKVTRVLERIYGDTQMEDLWMPFFCVSSNLTRAVAMVHRRGPLWQAVRASMAIPGLFSPILAEGDLLVDGCVLNNLPIDVMQRLNHDGPIIAVNVFPDVDLLRNYRFGPSVSGLQALFSKLNPLRNWDSSAPLIFESLMRVLALNDVHMAKTKRGFADVYIRPPVEKYNIMDFGAYAQVAELGYQSAMEALEDWENLPRRDNDNAETFSGNGMDGSMPRDNVTAQLDKTLAELEELLRRI